MNFNILALKQSFTYFPILFLFFISYIEATPFLTFSEIKTATKRSHQYHIKTIGEMPQIDGNINDEIYKRALKIDTFTNETGDQGPTTLYLAHYKEFLLFAAKCEVEDISKIKAMNQANQNDLRVWVNDCFDMTLQVNEHIYQILIDSSASTYDTKDRDHTWNLQMKKATGREGNAFTIELAIPLKELGIYQFDKQLIKMCLGRLDRNESTQTLTTPFGNIEKAASFFIGTDENFKNYIQYGNLTRNLNASIYTDREEYSDFSEQASGRIELTENSGPPLKHELILKLSLASKSKTIFTERVHDIHYTKFDFNLNLNQIPPDNYTLNLLLCDGNEVFKRIEKTISIKPKKVKDSAKIEIKIPASKHILKQYPISFGVPFPWGALKNDQNLKLTNHQGEELPLQTEVTARWSKEGGIRWALCDTIVPIRNNEQKIYLHYGPNLIRTQKPLLEVEQKHDDLKKLSLAINNGKLKIYIPKNNSPGISQVTSTQGYSHIVPSSTMGPYMVSNLNKKYFGINDKNSTATIESIGPLKATVKVEGWHKANDGSQLGKFILRYHIYKGIEYIFTDHTFIITEKQTTRYRDIGYSLPGYSSKGFFGAERIVPYQLSNSKDANAYLLQRDDLYGKVVSNKAFQEDFGKSEGWMSAGDLTISMRDFWQNFPKEFEAQHNKRIIHFWPAHHEEPIHHDEKLSMRNTYMLWFAHEGKELNFTPPQNVIDNVKKDGSNYENVPKASPVGLAKTHHLLLHFHGGNWAKANAYSTAKVFQSAITGIVDPNWICKSKVFGEIAEANSKKYPNIEKAFQATVQRYIRQQRVDRDFGMWNFGDAHHIWNWRDRRWRLYRTWRSTHHNWPRWPLIQAIRSGEPSIYQYFYRKMEHVADISHCNYSNEEFQKEAYPTGKILGGICDYKGLVHWAAGNRLGYNSVADTLLNHFYLTGNRRSLDVALHHGRALLKEGRTMHGREASARVASLTSLFMHTWDMEYLVMLEKQVNFLAKLAIDNILKKDPDYNNLTLWTHGMSRYYDLTGAEKAKHFITHWADLLIKTGAEALFPHQDGIEMSGACVIEFLSTAYKMTQNPIYLEAATTKVHTFSNYLCNENDPRYQNSTSNYVENRMVSWFLYDTPYYLSAIDQYGKQPKEMVFPPKHGIAALFQSKIKGKPGRMFYARIQQSQEGEFKVQLKVKHLAMEAELKDLKTGKIYQATIDSKGEHNMISISIPRDDSLDYAFRLYLPNSYIFVPLPIATGQEGIKEVYPFLVPGSGRSFIKGGEHFFFSIPESAASTHFGYTGRYGQSFELFNPFQQKVLHEVNTASNGPNEFQVPLQQYSKKNWSFRVRSGSMRGSICVWPTRTQGIPSSALWFGISKEKLFQPEEKAFSWIY